MKKLLAALLALALLMAACGALAENVVFENLHYGQEAFQMHLNEEHNFIVFQGEEYSLNDDCASYEGRAELYGGKTRAVYEMTVPQDQFTVEDSGEDLVFGEWIINIPYRAKLWIAQGNRVSGEYVLEGPIDLTEPYMEEVSLPRDENGHPLLVDRIYLYSYQVGEETRRFAASLYIDYEGYLAGRPASAAVSEQTLTMSPVLSDAGVSPVVAAVGVCVLAAAVAAAWFLRKKRRAPVAITVQEEEDLTAQSMELLKLLEEEENAVQDETVRGKAARLRSLFSQIIEMVGGSRQKTAGLRRFTAYYLPAAIKLLRFWRSAEGHDVDEAGRAEALDSVSRGMDMIIDACQKKLNSLHGAEQLDISTDLSALEQVLRREGLADGGLKLPAAEEK